jgi:hypothetical protein
MLSIFRICLTNIDFGQVGIGQLKAFPGFPFKGYWRCIITGSKWYGLVESG